MTTSELQDGRARQNRMAVARVAGAGAISLAVGMGIGRFAFTPILPMMLHDGVLDLGFGSWLATANYAGYLAGAALCMLVPRLWPTATLVKAGLGATILLTFGMVWHAPALWPAMRFLAGVASAVAFVYTSEWCLRRLGELGAPATGALIFTGPGAGIALSGIVAMAAVETGQSSRLTWLTFGILAACLSAAIWPVFSGRGATPSADRPVQPRLAACEGQASMAEMVMLTLAYGLAGFGYIITATYLPVMARAALPASVWLDVFWPIFGVASVAGCVCTTRVPRSVDPRLALAACFALQAVGVLASLLVPTLMGFVAGSAFVGFPLTVIAFFTMQDARRLQPETSARFIGLLTAVYGVGQILGPLLVGFLLTGTADHDRGFSVSLWTATSALAAGGALVLLMRRWWPRPEAR
ncbi:MAG: YbfB/YjiJ family MFS transporter [Acetobacteraceae bacterium]|nr:YbfB/YjiJ family MFS transporter [Acetobacteraceae bacterium]